MPPARCFAVRLLITTMNMEKVKIKYSVKNFPLSSKNLYLKAMFEKIESFINCLISTNYFIVETLLKVYCLDLPPPSEEPNGKKPVGDIILMILLVFYYC